jgi:hypothetical protein
MSLGLTHIKPELTPVQLQIITAKHGEGSVKNCKPGLFLFNSYHYLVTMKQGGLVITPQTMDSKRAKIAEQLTALFADTRPSEHDVKISTLPIGTMPTGFEHPAVPQSHGRPTLPHFSSLIQSINEEYAPLPQPRDGKTLPSISEVLRFCWE